MFLELKAEVKRQGKKMKDLADWLGMTESQLSKKLNGVNPLRLEEVYGIMDFLELPLSELPQYFPRKVVTAC